MVCRDFGSLPAILLMAGIKPMSSILSTSSRTRVLMFSKVMSLLSSRSSSRPGVAIISLAPARTACSWSRSEVPPISKAAAGSRLPRSCSYCLPICSANSRVGTSTNASSFASFVSNSLSMTGSRKARVLPVPVWAVAMMSLPRTACGMAAAWTSVGLINSAARRRSCR